MRMYKPEDVFKMPKGSMKDRLLKYNLLKLITCVLIIVVGLYITINVFHGYFYKGKFINEKATFETTAIVHTMKGPVNYYYPIVKTESSTHLFNEMLNKIENEADKKFVKSYYYQKKKNGRYYLKNDVSKEEYTQLFNMMKGLGFLHENLQRGYKLPKDALVNDTFPVIFLIDNPDDHYAPNTTSMTSHKELRKFIKQARFTEFIWMFWSPLIPILGFLWLFFSVKHTYKRQQEFNKQKQKQ